MNSTAHDSLIVFTRLPVAGKAKTRLIPLLGAEGAAEWQRRMTMHTVGRAWALTAADATWRLRIAHDGSSAEEMREWLGPIELTPQGEGDLGERISRCIQREFKNGARSVIVIGTDCPRLNEAALQEARDALRSASVVFGPSEDGGYYLIGLDRPMPWLFTGIPWGTDKVLAKSLSLTCSHKATHSLLQVLPDVDLPADLADAEIALAQGRSVSVIIPALNEAANLTRLLPRLLEARPHEILVADGGSTDATRTVAENFGVRAIECARGRANQMNRAALQATGEHLLFLHADTEPPAEFCELICRHLSGAGVAAGAFRFSLREPSIWKGLIEKLVAIRCAARQLPYGDQGIFMRRSVFVALGGFPDWPILEDLHLVRQARQWGRIAITQEAALTSARRWHNDGVLATFLRHQMILLGFHFGLPPQRLATWRSNSQDRPDPATAK